MRLLFAILILNLFMHTAYAEKRDISITTLDFSPYISETLPNNGWAWEVAYEALLSQGYRAHLEILPWARAVKMVEIGRYDALYMANYNEERNSWAIFSDPVGQEITVPFKLKARNLEITNIQEMRNLRVSSLRGAHVTNKVAEMGVITDPTTDIKSGITRVYQGRSDLFIADKFVTMHLIKTEMPSNYYDSIEPLDFAVDSNHLHLAFSRKIPDHMELVSAFNKGLTHLRETGLYDAILKKHGF
ncbi:MAG: transporter substrate-binding domain-containing protein [Alphaproteobacteria bacterium]|nr:transporter substrate-binding domain-containing protein [Alphaproteobacteria bacterium]